jgi:uncharacterized protein YjaZ
MKKVIGAVLLLVVLPLLLTAQSKPSFGQVLGVAKKLKTDLAVVGVMSTTLTSKDIESMTRSAMQQGVKLFVTEPKDVREVSALYKTLVNDKKVQLIIIPDNADKTMTGMGFDFIKENATIDRVGICAPDPSLVAQGAMCSVVRENDKIVVYVNQKVLAFVSAKIPTDEASTINFVLR